MVFDDIVLMMRVFVTTEECSDFGRIERKVDRKILVPYSVKKLGVCISTPSVLLLGKKKFGSAQT